MKKKKFPFKAYPAVEILVTDKMEKVFSLTKWSHFCFCDLHTDGKDYVRIADLMVHDLALEYPHLYFMERHTTRYFGYE